MRSLQAAALLAIMVLPGRGFAAGTNSAEFLRLGAGQPSALADASGASNQGATAIYWNPAGLAGLRQSEGYFSHLALPLGVRADLAFLGVPVSKGPLQGVIGGGLQVLTQKSIPRIDNTGTDQGRFGAYDMAATIAWARKWDLARAGLSAKFIRQSIDDESGSSAALDLGVQKDVGRASLGAALLNLGPPLKIGRETFPLPVTVRVGGTYKIVKGLMGASDFTFSKDQGPRLHLGAKYKLAGPLNIGLGYAVGDAQGDGPSGLAAGVGFEWERLTIDLAMRPYGELGNVFQIGVGYRFGKGSGNIYKAGICLPLATQAGACKKADAPAPAPDPVVTNPPPAADVPLALDVAETQWLTNAKAAAATTGALDRDRARAKVEDLRLIEEARANPSNPRPPHDPNPIFWAWMMALVFLVALASALWHWRRARGGLK